MREKKERSVTMGFYSEEAHQLYEMLDRYMREGCRLELEGKEEIPEQIVAACVRERSNYMMDFIDDGRKIRAIDFIRVRDQE